MKISAEVREFARLNPSTVRPELVEGQHFSSGSQNKDGASTGSARTGVEEAEAEAGMAEMSKRFHDEGGEIYLPAAE